MTSTAEFWDRVAEGYAKRPVSDPAAYAQTLDRTRTYLSQDDAVLELGCGTGSTALKLAPFVARIEGTDVSPEMIRIAQAKPTTSDNVVFRVAGAEDTDAQERDAVIAFNLLHLVEDIPAVAAQAHRTLKPGGYFITKSACLAENGAWLRPVIKVMQWIGKAPFVRFLKIAELEEMIRNAGFEIVETGDYPAKPPNHFIVARKI